MTLHILLDSSIKYLKQKLSSEALESREELQAGLQELERLKKIVFNRQLDYSSAIEVIHIRLGHIGLMEADKMAVILFRKEQLEKLKSACAEQLEKLKSACEKHKKKVEEEEKISQEQQKILLAILTTLRSFRKRMKLKLSKISQAQGTKDEVSSIEAETRAQIVEFRTLYDTLWCEKQFDKKCVAHKINLSLDDLRKKPLKSKDHPIQLRIDELEKLLLKISNILPQLEDKEDEDDEDDEEIDDFSLVKRMVHSNLLKKAAYDEKRVSKAKKNKDKTKDNLEALWSSLMRIRWNSNIKVEQPYYVVLSLALVATFKLGEPIDNLEELLDNLKILHDKEGIELAVHSPFLYSANFENLRINVEEMFKTYEGIEEYNAQVEFLYKDLRRYFQADHVKFELIQRLWFSILLWKRKKWTLSAKNLEDDMIWKKFRDQFKVIVDSKLKHGDQFTVKDGVQIDKPDLHNFIELAMTLCSQLSRSLFGKSPTQRLRAKIFYGSNNFASDGKEGISIPRSHSVEKLRDGFGNIPKPAFNFAKFAVDEKKSRCGLTDMRFLYQFQNGSYHAIDKTDKTNFKDYCAKHEFSQYHGKGNYVHVPTLTDRKLLRK